MKYWNRCCQSKARPFVVLGVAVLCCMLVRWIVSSGCKYRICGCRGWGFEAHTPSKFKLIKFTQIYYLKQGPWTSSGIQNYPPPREKLSGSEHISTMSFLVKSFRIKKCLPEKFFIGLTFQLDLFAVTRSKCPQSSFFELQRAYESLAVAQRERHVSSLLTIRTTTNQERSTTDKLIEKASSSSFVN